MHSRENSKSPKLICLVQLFSIVITIGNIVYSSAVKRTPVDYASFVITATSPYTILKYSNCLYHIYTASLVAQIITLLTSLLTLLILISLAKTYSFNCFLPKNAKTCIILYLAVAISILGQTLVCGHFIQMRVQLIPYSTSNGRQQLVIGILSGIDWILLVTVLVATFYLSFYKFESDQPNAQPNVIDAMQVPKNMSNLPLRTILNNRLTLHQINNSQERHRRTDKVPSSRRYIKSTIPRNAATNQQHNPNQHPLLPISTIPKQSKEPLLQVQDRFSHESGQSDNERYLLSKVDLGKQERNIRHVNTKSAVNLSNLSISIIKPRTIQKTNKNIRESHLSRENDISKSKSNAIILAPVQNDQPPKIQKKNLRLNLKDIKLKLQKESELVPHQVRQRKEEATFQMNQIDSVFLSDQ